MLGASDAQLAYRLGEIKTIHPGPSRYPRHVVAQRAAVNRRAAAVQAEYDLKAAKFDRRYCGVAPGQMGPMQAKLQSYGNIIAVVSGAFGEFSDAADFLFTTMAEMGADTWHRRLNAASRDDARAFLTHHMRMQAGMCGARGCARLLLHRLQFIHAWAGDRYARYQPGGGASSSAGCYGADNAFRYFSTQRGRPAWVDGVGAAGLGGRRAGRACGRGGSHFHGGRGIPRG